MVAACLAAKRDGYTSAVVTGFRKGLKATKATSDESWVRLGYLPDRACFALAASYLCWTAFVISPRLIGQPRSVLSEEIHDG